MSAFLHRQVEFLALDNPGFLLAIVFSKLGNSCGYILCVVDPEKVGVQNGLDQAGNDGDRVEEARHFHEIPVDPVGNIQRTVGAERE